MDIQKVKTYLKSFNRAMGSSLELGPYIGFGLTSMVFEVKRVKGFVKKSKYQEYDNQGMVLKIMQTHVTYDDVECVGGKLRERTKEIPLNDREYYLGLYRQEVELMNLLKNSGYTMPLLGSLELTDQKAEHKYTFMLLMPKMKNLADELCCTDTLKESELIRIGCDIAHALELCHKNKILHRDVKRGNVYIDQYSDHGKRYILGDFGCCRSFEKDPFGRVTKVSNSVTDDPALFQGKIRPNTYVLDVFQLGCMLQGMAREGQDRGLSLGKKFEDILRKATDEQVDQRYPDGGSMCRALDSLTKNEKCSNTTILINSARNQAIKAIRNGDFEGAMRILENGGSECDILWRYCRGRNAVKAQMEPGGHIREIRELIAEMERVVLEKTFENDCEMGQYLCLNAMLKRTIGYMDGYVQTMEQAAEFGFVPAMYYYGSHVCGTGGGNRADHLKARMYLCSAARMGCEEALEFFSRYDRTEWPQELYAALLDAEYSKVPRKRRDNLFVRYL